MRWAAIIADISQGGVQLLLERRFEKGTGLAIELPGDGVHEPTVVFVKVVHLRRQDDGTWALGCRFISELGDDELQRLLTSTNHVLSSSKHEEEQVDEISEPAEAETPHKRFLTDVHLLVDSPSGAVVECLINRLNVTRSWPLTAGKVLCLNGKRKDESPWSMRIQVAECVAQGEGWEIQGRMVGSSNAADGMHARR